MLGNILEADNARGEGGEVINIAQVILDQLTIQSEDFNDSNSETIDAANSTDEEADINENNAGPS